jgi:general secretion pathway protein F
MPIYTYKGLDRTGKEIKSSINTDSVQTAKQKIKSMGLMLVDIKEKHAAGSSSSKFFNFKGSVSVEDLALMTRQFATLIQAKIQIVEALSALSDQVDNETLRVILAGVKQKVNEGATLADALGEHPKIFNNVYVNMVQSGEASGTLEVVLLRLADFTENQMKLKNKIKGAMTYPVIMGFFGFAMMNVIFIFVIPKIAKIFISMKKELPLQTKFCIWLSGFLQNYWWAVFLAMFLIYKFVQRYVSTKSGESNWHHLQLKLPIIGTLTKMINVSRFCSTLGTLLNSGVPILTAMTIVKNLVPNVHMKVAIDSARQSVSEGASITGPLISSGYFPPLVTHMIKLGESSGELEPMLKIISENYEDQVESKIAGLTSVLEPIMMVFLGIGAAFIVFSVIVPMMSINSVN